MKKAATKAAAKPALKPVPKPAPKPVPKPVRKSAPQSGAKPAAKGAARPARKTYHHGNLRQALVEASADLAAEQGAESVSVRQAARRVGVSSGAPFRHFASRAALMTAVAEEAMRRFMLEIAGGMNRSAKAPARERLRRLAHAFVRWALRNPTHFKILSARDLIEIDSSVALQRDIRAARMLAIELITAAQLGPVAAKAGIPRIELMSRALVYGLARMNVDGQMAQWDIAPQDAERVTLECVDAFLALLER